MRLGNPRHTLSDSRSTAPPLVRPKLLQLHLLRFRFAASGYQTRALKRVRMNDPFGLAKLKWTLGNIVLGTVQFVFFRTANGCLREWCPCRPLQDIQNRAVFPCGRDREFVVLAVAGIVVPCTCQIYPALAKPVRSKVVHKRFCVVCPPGRSEGNNGNAGRRIGEGDQRKGRPTRRHPTPLLPRRLCRRPTPHALISHPALFAL